MPAGGQHLCSAFIRSGTAAGPFGSGFFVVSFSSCRKSVGGDVAKKIWKIFQTAAAGYLVQISVP
jgi:hypothetical protein